MIRIPNIYIRSFVGSFVIRNTYMIIKNKYLMIIVYIITDMNHLPETKSVCVHLLHPICSMSVIKF